MDPVTIGLTVAGFATSILGTMSASSDAKQISGYEQQNAGLEMQVNAQRKNAMEIDARRRQLDTVRNAQRSRHAAVATVQGQTGSTQGTGLQGAQAQLSGQGNFNLQGINQNLEIGRNIFGLDTSISQNKIAIAGLQGSQGTAQGIAAIGGDISRSATSLGNISQQISPSVASLFNGPFGIG
jgi:hypothetical protein